MDILLYWTYRRMYSLSICKTPKTALLGHSDIGITMILYVHTTEDEKHKAWYKKDNLPFVA